VQGFLLALLAYSTNEKHNRNVLVDVSAMGKSYALICVSLLFFFIVRKDFFGGFGGEEFCTITI
jgi:hypothetical protein